jgi:hypothetical protein
MALGRLRRADERYRDIERRGRHRLELTALQRRAVAAMVRRDPTIGLPSLRRAIPGLPKNSTAAYLHRLKRVAERLRRRRICRLQWQVPGAVWAIDGTWFDQPVANHGRRALVVVEMHSKKTLCLQSVPGERASSAIACLQGLVAKYGAPLVLKADNGAAFTAVSFTDFCEQHGITLMHSPVRRPQWNGTCEISGRWAKRRATASATLRGAPRIEQQDLDAAVSFAGAMPRIDADLRRRFRNLVRAHFATLVRERGLVSADSLREHVRRSLGRVAARRALQLCHILTIRGREYRQWFQPQTA